MRMDHTKTEYMLQIRNLTGSTNWRPALAKLYKQAQLAVFYGNLTEGIQLAEELHIENYGDMHDVEFRCITHTKTITTLGNASPEMLVW